MYSTCILFTLFVAAKIISATPTGAPTVEPTTKVPTVSVNGEIECGVSMEYGSFRRLDVPWDETKIFSFSNEEKQNVVFSNCYSYGDTYMKLYDSDWNDITNQSVGGCNGNDCSGGNAWNGSYFSCSHNYSEFADDNGGNVFGGSATKETFAMANLAAGEYYLLVGWMNPDAIKNVTTYYTVRVSGGRPGSSSYENVYQDQISPVFVGPLCFNDCLEVDFGDWLSGERYGWEWCPKWLRHNGTVATFTTTNSSNIWYWTTRGPGDEGSRLSAVVAMATLCVIGLFTM